MAAAPFETFPALESQGWLRHGFIQRVPGIDVQADRETAIARLISIHEETLPALGLGERKLITAQQVHGKEVVRVDASTFVPVAGADGLITNDPGVVLGIFVADCGAIYLADPRQKALGLLHSGKKGSELGILTAAIEAMEREFGSRAADLIVQLGPCIRPPHYEIDFARQIADQAEKADVGQFSDCGTCTAADLDHYYSYRREMGKTGRLFAVLGYAS